MSGIISTIEKRVFALSPLLQILFAISVGALFLALVLIVVWFFSAPQRAATAQGQAKAAIVGTAAAQSAGGAQTKILDQGAQRDAHTASVRSENARAIATLPSAPALAAPPADADAWRRGLCMYQSSAGDPECVRLQHLDSAKLQKPHP